MDGGSAAAAVAVVIVGLDHVLVVLLFQILEVQLVQIQS
jgi:hypothetical protein